MEALKEDGTSATTIIVWDRPSHLRESQPAPLPPRACSLLSPAPTAQPALYAPPRSPPWWRKEQKRGESEPETLPRPQPQTERFLGSSGSTKISRPSLLIIKSRSSLPSASPWYTLPFPASLPVMTPPGWNSLFLTGGRLQKALYGGGGRHGRICFSSSPPPSSRIPVSLHAAREQYQSVDHAYSIWHPFACTPRAALQHLVLTMKDTADLARYPRLPPCTLAPISVPYKLRAL